MVYPDDQSVLAGGSSKPTSAATLPPPQSTVAHGCRIFADDRRPSLRTDNHGIHIQPTQRRTTTKNPSGREPANLNYVDEFVEVQGFIGVRAGTDTADHVEGHCGGETSAVSRVWLSLRMAQRGGKREGNPPLIISTCTKPPGGASNISMPSPC